MSQLVESIISDLRSIGLDLRDMGDGWFALHDDAEASTPEVFLHLTNNDLAEYLGKMTDEDVDGAYGPGVGPDEARYSLTLTHLEEALLAGDDTPRYVIVDGGAINVFSEYDAKPHLPPGDYEWRAAPQ